MKRWIIAVSVLAGLPAVSLVQRSLADDKPATREAKEEKDVKLAVADCPKAVQDGLKAQAGAGKIGDISKEDEDGKTTYEADVVIDGKEYEIKLAADGSLISKKLEDAEDEKDQKDEKK